MDNDSVQLVLEYSSCDESQEWTPIAVAQTGSGRSAGAAEINFEFKNTPEFCRYRVVLQQAIGKFPFVTYPIDTLTEQEIQGDRSHK
jgi:hypothetical protein